MFHKRGMPFAPCKCDGSAGVVWTIRCREIWYVRLRWWERYGHLNRLGKVARYAVIVETLHPIPPRVTGLQISVNGLVGRRDGVGCGLGVVGGGVGPINDEFDEVISEIGQVLPFQDDFLGLNRGGHHQRRGW